MDFAPFHFLDAQTIHYWDTSIVAKHDSPYHLIDILHKQALDGSIRCYAYDGSKQYSHHDLAAILKCNPDTLAKNTPHEFVNYDLLVLTGSKKAVVVEEWSQKANGALESKILAIGPIRHRYDDAGNYTGAMLMCWYVLNY